MLRLETVRQVPLGMVGLNEELYWLDKARLVNLTKVDLTQHDLN